MADRSTGLIDAIDEAIQDHVENGLAGMDTTYRAEFVSSVLAYVQRRWAAEYAHILREEGQQ